MTRLSVIQLRKTGVSSVHELHNAASVKVGAKNAGLSRRCIRNGIILDDDAASNFRLRVVDFSRGSHGHSRRCFAIVPALTRASRIARYVEVKSFLFSPSTESRGRVRDACQFSSLSSSSLY